MANCRVIRAINHFRTWCHLENNQLHGGNRNARLHHMTLSLIIFLKQYTSSCFIPYLRELTRFFAQGLADWVSHHCTQHYETSSPSRPGPLADTHTCSHQHRYAHMNINMLKCSSLNVCRVRSVWDVYLEDKIRECLKRQGSRIFGSVPLELGHICSQIHWNIRHNVICETNNICTA